MSGIAHLSDILKKKGKDFVDRMFDKYVTVNEKIDAAAFGVEKDSFSGELKFYKRNTDIPISLIDRTLMRYYEKAIRHFKDLSPEVIAKLPAGWRFGMEYFVTKQPQVISYDRLPKNGLVMSYIHVKNKAGKLVRTIQDKEELNQWADLLDVERSPVIFQGHLTHDQKIKIMDFVMTPFEELVGKFKTKSFVKYVISVLNSKLKKTTLNDDLEKHIEGLVFRFGDADDNDVVLAKMVDPVFEMMAKEKAKKKDEEHPNDIYNLTIVDLMNYIETVNMNKFKPRGKTYEERYLDFISKIFNSFITDYGDKYNGLDFNEPAFMKRKEFDLNLDFINNDDTKSKIEENESYKRLFKILLASFRKKKKRPNGILTTEVLRQFNTTIDKIHAHLAEGLMENEVPTFGEFLSIRGERTLDADSSEDVDVEERELETFMDFRERMGQIMDSDESTEDPEAKKKVEKKPENPEEDKDKFITKRQKRRANILVGRFQPFHNGHMTVCKELNEMNKLPVIVVVVHPGHNSSGHSPFSQSTIKSSMSNLPEESEGTIQGSCMIGRGFIGDVVNEVRKMGYEPILWGAGNDRVNDYKKQLEFNFKKDNEMNLTDDFRVVETDRHGSGTEVRKAIESDDYGKFKSLVPKSVQGLYHLLKSDFERSKREAEEAAKEKNSKS